MGQGTLGASKCPLCPIETDADESWLLQMNVALPICKQLEGEAEIVLSPSRRTESARQRKQSLHGQPDPFFQFVSPRN
jgi:hypothetical protein